MTSVMQTESDEDRTRIIKKLNKREYYVYYRRDLPEEDQYITGFVREEWCLIEKDKDGTIKLGFIKTPHYGRYGIQVMAKRRPNGRYWFISNAYADSLEASYTDAMYAVAYDSTTLPRFDANDLTQIYS